MIHVKEGEKVFSAKTDERIKRSVFLFQIYAGDIAMRCTFCLLILTLCSAAAGCNYRMPMCIGSFRLHSK